jgi:4-hydroxy-3-methylbut-2-en-1-yl diphosphate synthase IspG/GcpE
MKDIKNIVLSMKAKVTRRVIWFMVYTSFWFQTMNRNNMFTHCTLVLQEAGDGDDGRIKSALSVLVALLEVELAIPFRVSLTLRIEFEVPVAQRMALTVAPYQSLEVSSKN